MCFREWPNPHPGTQDVNSGFYRLTKGFVMEFLSVLGRAELLTSAFSAYHSRFMHSGLERFGAALADVHAGVRSMTICVKEGLIVGGVHLLFLEPDVGMGPVLNLIFGHPSTVVVEYMYAMESGEKEAIHAALWGYVDEVVRVRGAEILALEMEDLSVADPSADEFLNIWEAQGFMKANAPYEREVAEDEIGGLTSPALLLRWTDRTKPGSIGTDTYLTIVEALRATLYQNDPGNDPTYDRIAASIVNDGRREIEFVPISSPRTFYAC